MSVALMGAAFVAGLLMFLAPCTLPIVPGYVAFIAGGAGARSKIIWNALAFVVGFSAVFVALGASAGFAGTLIGPWKALISQLAGAVLIFFGLMMLGWLRVPFVSNEHHIKLPAFIRVGRWESSILIGALFALGWSPCIGPIFATILFMASSTSTAALGAFLLFIFSLGMGLPFILTAALMQSGQNMFGTWAATSRVLSIIGGLVLMGIGILMLTNHMGLLVGWGFQFFEGPYNQLLKYM